MRQPSAFGVSIAAAVVILLMTASVLRAASVDTNQSGVGNELAAGRATFLQFCATCHGADGKGAGPTARFLYKAPADLTQIRRRHLGLFPHNTLETTLLAPTRSAVSPAMPPQMMLWGPIFLSVDGDPVMARARVVDLVAFIESLQEH